MLAKLAHRQRKSMHLDEDQIQLLHSIGFEWENPGKKQQEELWDRLYQRLVAHREANGDCKVPTSHNDDPELGVLVSNQRKRFHQGKLRQDRQEKLQEIDFCFVVRKSEGKPAATTSS